MRNYKVTRAKSGTRMIVSESGVEAIPGTIVAIQRDEGVLYVYLQESMGEIIPPRARQFVAQLDPYSSPPLVKWFLEGIASLTPCNDLSMIPPSVQEVGRRWAEAVRARQGLPAIT